NASDQIGFVFAGGELGGLLVRCFVGERIHRSAGDVGLLDGIGMDGDEEIGAGAAGNIDALFQNVEGIVFPGQLYLVIAAGEELFFQFLGDGERDVLFIRAVDAVRTRIIAAVAGIDDDQRLLTFYRRWRLIDSR